MGNAYSSSIMCIYISLKWYLLLIVTILEMVTSIAKKKKKVNSIQRVPVHPLWPLHSLLHSSGTLAIRLNPVTIVYQRLAVLLIQ